MRLAPLFAAALFAALPAAAQDRDSYEYREGYRRGYDDGFAAGYRKALEEGRGSPPPAPAYAPPPARLGPIRITRAIYGGSSRSCDATHFVKRQAEGRMSATVNVSNDMCGDPAKGDRKQLEVTFRCGDITKTASAYEHRSAYLDCNSAN
ncbi:MAG: hypothetical protein IPJ28_15790 [Betaproteobacteria bacterium]|nr:hypothetical protein [Betaproteobacteria bacterium]